MDNELLNREETAFDTENTEMIYGKPTKAVPVPPKNIGIDVDNELFQDIIKAGESSQLDISKLESFLNIAQSRDQIYDMLDAMAEDGSIAAVLETYAEDATEYNDQGQIVWAESSDSKIAKYVEFLLNTMNVDKNIYNWVYKLCKYGDVYIRLYRESEQADPVFGDKDAMDEADKNKRDTLNEDVRVKAYAKSDRYTHYVEAVPNPAEMFELTKFGKTKGYIKAPVGVGTSRNVTSNMQTYYQYNFKRKDVDVYAATEFVHACLEDSSSRTPEEVRIFLNDDTSADTDADIYSYNVKRGQSLLYNVFKIWRELMLLENSVLLNRITKSSIVRVIGVEVGDMPKEMVGPHLQGIKGLIEQKSALNEGKYISEYTNPGPIENNIYVPTRNGQGALTTQQIGGDVDVKSLADLDYFKNKLYGQLRVPKQYFGDTDDSTGFNGGTSLSIISSRYAKMVKRIQNTMIQAITDAVNLMLLDKGLDNYINKFQIHMMPPTTQEEIDRRDNLSSKISIVGDIMNNLSDIEDVTSRLKILKSLLSNVITDSEIIDIIQDEIDRIESEGETIEEASPTEGESGGEDFGGRAPASPARDVGSEINISMAGEEGVEEPESEAGAEELPNPSDLGVDFTDNTAEI